MTTRQTPDAVREAAEEIVALPHGLDIGYAQDIARRILAALDSRAGDAKATVITISVRPDGSTSFHSSIPPGQNWLDTLAAMNHGFLEFQRQFEESNKCPIKPSTAATPAPAVDADEGYNPEAKPDRVNITPEHNEALHGALLASSAAVDAVPAGEVEAFGGVPIAAIKAQMQAVEDEAARTLWIGAPILKGLTGYIRAALSHGEGRK